MEQPTITFTLNPAGQLSEEQVDNQLYAWGGQPSGGTDTDYVADGLNQYDSVDGTAFTHDTNGNLTSDGVTTFVYDTENRLISASGGNTVDLRYDPLGRLYEVEDGSGAIRRLLYSGSDLIGEYTASGTMLDRYVHGVSAGDDPLIRYAGSATAKADAEFLYANRLGSIVASFDRSGAVKAINSYDEFGVPGPSVGLENTGRFRYTGQIWLSELGMYHYKARAYSPTLGRFMQPDPIGYADGLNMYLYVGNDPVNAIDPTGLSCIVLERVDEEGNVLSRTESCGGGSGGSGRGDVFRGFWNFGPSTALGGFAPPAGRSGGPAGREQEESPKCNQVQDAFRATGEFLVDSGSDVAVAGIVLAGTGAAVAGVSASSVVLSPTGVLAGGALATSGGTIAALGSGAAAVGAGLQILGGSGKAAIGATVSRFATHRLPDGPAKDALESGIEEAVDAIPFEFQVCR